MGSRYGLNAVKRKIPLLSGRESNPDRPSLAYSLYSFFTVELFNMCGFHGSGMIKGRVIRHIKRDTMLFFVG
jgi:hypothetical protein